MLTYAPNEDSNHPRIRAVWSESSSNWSLAIQNALSEDSDPKVGFLTLRHICFDTQRVFMFSEYQNYRPLDSLVELHTHKSENDRYQVQNKL